MLDVLDNFVWTLRREGFAVSTPQAIDVARAAREVGFGNRGVLREALACVVVDSVARRPHYDQLFDEFFAAEGSRPVELTQRLLTQGFTSADLGALRELLREFLPQGGGRLRVLLTGGSVFDHLLASDAFQTLLSRLNNPRQLGFYAHRALEELGVGRARAALSVIGDGLSDALGKERALLLMQALVRELDRSEAQIRAQLERRLEALALLEAAKKGPLVVPFGALAEEEMDEVRSAVQKLAQRLRGAASVRRRHRQRGRLDLGRTVRTSLATGGIPFRQVRRDQRRDRPRLIVLCDLSDSVRVASRFMLEFVYAVSDLFERTRSFVFVSELGEVTKLLATSRVTEALAKVGSVVSLQGNTNYGRALREFENRYIGAVDRRTTVVILGDGRTNYQPNGADRLRRIRDRAKGVIWLCPEGRASWGSGDSAMPAYAESVTQVFEVASALDLERAARELVSRG